MTSTGVVVVYILGTGRSGSTALELALAETASVASLGEVARFAEWAGGGLSCACGASLTACSVWAPVTSVDDRGAGDVSVARALLSSLDDLGVPALVDSSKTGRTAWRRPYLWRAVGARVVGVHVLRPPDRVWESVRAGSNRWLEGHRGQNKVVARPRLYALWLFWNLVSMLTAVMTRATYVVVENREIAVGPAAVCARVLESAGVTTGSGGSGAGDHGIAGNRLRRSPTRSADRSPDEGLPAANRWVARLLYSGVVALARRLEQVTR